MKYKIPNVARMPVHSRTIGQLSEVEKFIELIANCDADNQLTFLLKLGQHYRDNDQEARKLNTKLQVYWQKLLGPNTEFGCFYNAEIGTIFIAGALTDVFMYNIKGKRLGELSGGPYGILRGLGIPEEAATTQIKDLNEGHYLLMIQGNITVMNFLNEASKSLNMTG